MLNGTKAANNTTFKVFGMALVVPPMSIEIYILYGVSLRMVPE